MSRQNTILAGGKFGLKANSRESVNVGDHVQTYNVSTKVIATQPVIAERSMYYSRAVQPQPEPEPEPQPQPPSYVYDFSGTGNKATELFGLQAGLTTLDFTHNGESNFIVRLVDSSGQTVEYLVNEIGPYSGGNVVGIETAGNFLLDIQADGYWTAHVAQPRPTSAPGVPQTYQGTAQNYTEFFTLNTGLARFDMAYRGESNFIVRLVDANGNVVEYLENEIGSRDDSTVVNVDSGIHLLDVMGREGSWTVIVSQ